MHRPVQFVPSIALTTVLACVLGCSGKILEFMRNRERIPIT